MDWKDKEEFDKFVKLIMSMSTDYLMGKITKETWLNNFVCYAQFMQEECPEYLREDLKK